MGGVPCRLCGMPCDGLIEQGEDSNMICCVENEYEYASMCNVCKDIAYADFKAEYIMIARNGPYCKRCDRYIPHIEDTHILKHLEEEAE